MSESDTKNVTDSINARFIEMLEDAYYRRRVAKKVVVNEICKVVGIKDRTVYRWEKGEEIKDKYHDKIANYFNVDVKWLQTGEGDRTPTSSVGDSPNVNRSGENPQQGWVETTNVNATLRNSDSTSSSRKTEGEKKMQAPDDWSGEMIRRIKIPGQIRLTAYGIPLITLIPSVPDPEWVHEADISDTITGLSAQMMNSPKNEKPSSEKE